MNDNASRTFVLSMLVWVGSMVLIGTGCPTDQPPLKDAGPTVEVPECEMPSDCDPGYICVDNICQREQGECQTDRDCPGEEVCREDNNCYPPADDDPDGMDAGDGSMDAGETGNPDGTGMDVETGGDTTPSDADTGGTCQGCILPGDVGAMASGACVPGDDKEACGKGGATCQACDAGEICKDQECQPKPCTPQNCPNGCCMNGVCKSGDSDSACGSGGDNCSQCSGDSVCQGGVCEVPCGPGTCNGCCDASGNCVSGDSDSTCGSNGSSCMSCGTDEKCSKGSCVELSCSQTCNGCCTPGGTCRGGTSDNACGSSGNYCQSCRDGFECDTRYGTNECDLKRSSRWDVLAVSADVPMANSSGVFWDARGNKPDVFVKVKVDGLTETKKGKTKTIEGNLNPFWYETTASDVLASDLKGYNNVEIKLIDEDPWYVGGNTTMVTCKKEFDDKHFKGSSVEFDCNENGNKTKIKLLLRWHQ